MADPRRFYFLGELGVFVQLALGAFEGLFRDAPETRIEILTYEDYGVLLQLLFPDNIARVIPYRGPPLFAHRFGIGLAGDYPREVDAIVAGMDDISGLVAAQGHTGPLYQAKQRIPNLSAAAQLSHRIVAYARWHLRAAKGPFFPVLPISAPLGQDVPPGARPTICLLPRFRAFRSSSDRNLTSDFWNTLIRDHIAPRFAGRADLVLCGLDAERVAGLHDDIAFVRPADMQDEIRLLSNAALLVCPLSGYGQLASYCGTGVLYVLNDEPIGYENQHLATVRQSNIFDRDLGLLRQCEVLADPMRVITMIERNMGPPSVGTERGATL